MASVRRSDTTTDSSASVSYKIVASTRSSLGPALEAVRLPNHSKRELSEGLW